VYDNPVDARVKLPAPTNVNVTNSADTAVTLTWSYAQKYLSQVQFAIEQKIDNGNFAFVANTAMGKTAYLHNDSFSVTKTYVYRVRAIADKNKGLYSENLTMQFNFTAPQRLTATFLADTAVRLQWIDSSDFETGFIIEQKEDTSAFQIVDSANANTTSKTISGVFLTSHTYTFRIFVKSRNNTSDYTYSDTGRVTFPPPKNLTGTFLADTAVWLQWIDSSNFETGFMIEQSTNGTTYELKDSVTANITTTKIDGIYYITQTMYFRVRAKSKNNFSGYTSTNRRLNFPPPSNLTVAFFADTAVRVQWQDNSNFETGFLIEQKEDNNAFQIIDSTNPNTTTKIVSAVFLNSHTYTFRVRAKSKNNVSGYSSEVSKTFTFPQPYNLSAYFYFTPDTIKLSWQDTCSFETGFEIEKSINDSNNFSIIQAIGANITTATIHGTFDSSSTYYFRVRANSKYNSSDFSNIVNTRFFNIEMITVQGGSFRMGDSLSGYNDEQPVHIVTLNNFSMSKYEITHHQWIIVRDWGLNNGYFDLPNGRKGYYGDSTHPVTEVNWYDIVKWCNALSERNGKIPVYYTNSSLTTIYKTGQIDIQNTWVNWYANGFRIPTEAEWEYAARGGIHSGDDYRYSGSDDVNAVAWYNGNSALNTHMVGTKAANQLGIYDMSGNIWEWCWDWYSSSYYYVSPSNNPKGPTSGLGRILRGGSWNYNNSDCRVASRNYNSPDYRSDGTGFRLVQGY